MTRGKAEKEIAKLLHRHAASCRQSSTYRVPSPNAGMWLALARLVLYVHAQIESGKCAKCTRVAA